MPLYSLQLFGTIVKKIAVPDFFGFCLLLKLHPTIICVIYKSLSLIWQKFLKIGSYMFSLTNSQSWTIFLEKLKKVLTPEKLQGTTICVSVQLKILSV